MRNMVDVSIAVCLTLVMLGMAFLANGGQNKIIVGYECRDGESVPIHENIPFTPIQVAGLWVIWLAAVWAVWVICLKAKWR